MCEAVCPVKECVTLVNETEFSDNSSQWQSWKQDKEAYKVWLAGKIKGDLEAAAFENTPVPNPGSLTSACRSQIKAAEHLAGS